MRFLFMPIQVAPKTNHINTQFGFMLNSCDLQTFHFISNKFRANVDIFF